VTDGASPTTDDARAGSRVAAIASRWALPALWLTLPFTAGPALGDALATTDAGFRNAVSVGLWVVWGTVFGATLIPRTVTLTAVRIAAPVTLVACGWAAAATSSAGVADVVALTVSAAVTVVALAPATGAAYVNGSAYGLEHRLPLRAPGALLLGPIELAWMAAVAGAAAGPLLLADQLWVAGGVVLVVGWPIAWWASRSLHVLSRRWLVFTPAGLVLHDPLAVVESVLVIRRHLRSIGPALVGTTARDLTVGAPGLALEVDLTESLPISPAPRRRLGARDPVESEEIDALLFTPTRPGRVLAEAAARHLPVA
jgi:hypothetical protein